MKPDEIAGAARRVIHCCVAMLDAQDRGDAEPGECADMRSPDYTEPALAIQQMTTPSRDLKDLGQAFGDVAAAMSGLTSDDVALDDPSWWMLRDFLRACHTSWGPYDYVVADNRRLSVVESAPSEIRFDLLAALVTHDAAEELCDAAQWVLDQLTD
jgi:hypothetical protein